jgi:hypothetical protein
MQYVYQVIYLSYPKTNVAPKVYKATQTQKIRFF